MLQASHSLGPCTLILSSIMLHRTCGMHVCLIRGWSLNVELSSSGLCYVELLTSVYLAAITHEIVQFCLCADAFVSCLMNSVSESRDQGSMLRI
jgi:hypothetical protein